MALVRSLSLAVLLWPAILLAGEAAPASEAVPENAPGWTASAFAREEYRVRFANSPNERDQQARLALDADLTSPGETVAFLGSFGLWWRPDESYANPSVIASPRDRFWTEFYQLSARWRPNGVIESVGAGRLEAEHGPAATFDGLTATLHPFGPARFFAFGGKSVHFFSIDQRLFEDWIASAGFELRGERWRLEADYRLLAEDLPTTIAVKTPARTRIENHTYGVTGLYRAGGLAGKVGVRGIDQGLALLHASGRAESVERRMGADLRLELQPATLRELNDFDDPYFLILGESKPHYRARLDLFKGFATSRGDFTGHLGATVRQLVGADESRFNRNLLRAYLLVSADRLFGTGLFASAMGEVDRVAGGKGLFAAGGGLGWDGGRLRAEAGTAWHRYHYVYYQSPEETANVREIYADLRWKLFDWFAIRARYSNELFDRRLQTFTFSLSEAYR